MCKEVLAFRNVVIILAVDSSHQDIWVLLETKKCLKAWIETADIILAWVD